MTCIELIGCTSAGKSTLASHILEACHANGIDVALGEDFALKQTHLDWVKNTSARAVLVNLVAVLAALGSWRNLEFYRFAMRVVSQLPDSVRGAEKRYISRNIFKNIGIYEIARRRVSSRQIVLLDEGPLHTSQALFVHLSAGPKETDLSTFTRLVPLPDVAIYLRQDESVLIERTLARGHKRIPGGSRILAERFIRCAVGVFDYLIQYPAIEQRLLMVDGNQTITVPQPAQNDSPRALALKILQTGLGITDSAPQSSQ